MYWNVLKLIQHKKERQYSKYSKKILVWLYRERGMEAMAFVTKYFFIKNKC